MQIMEDLGNMDDPYDPDEMVATNKLHEMGIASDWRDGKDVFVKLRDGTIRLATKEEEKLRDRSIYEFLREEARCGVI